MKKIIVCFSFFFFISFFFLSMNDTDSSSSRWKHLDVEYIIFSFFLRVQLRSENQAQCDGVLSKTISILTSLSYHVFSLDVIKKLHCSSSIFSLSVALDKTVFKEYLYQNNTIWIVFFYIVSGTSRRLNEPINDRASCNLLKVIMKGSRQSM